MVDNIFEIKITDEARHDLEKIYDYISLEFKNDIAAKKLIRKIRDSIIRLREFPYMSELLKDEILRKKGYRKIVIDNYIVIYKVNKDERLVIIVRIIYNRRQYQDLI
ncbi:type II toxin-antitoxin system RelE/ParE family toxin [Halanaerobiaceae bacterium Z-7014]|uniref:Type II toxin-antitoxin system RelE/ParE family toxin n=1 Tax=Halonatronomonas betaini TaxID=2778430 RepID=A0A931AZP9_9FIRM|nr:type II toxin-antitoxin system RelE/ParE family toxin [Halonatronomonas betaini]MBF8437738.1 type II toxin-antitoxin system RelE/ParE family toxin [Halonatronomonas betaini]